MSPLTYEAWKHVPSAYVICLKDKTIPLKQVKEIVERAKIVCSPDSLSVKSYPGYLVRLKPRNIVSRVDGSSDIVTA